MLNEVARQRETTTVVPKPSRGQRRLTHGMTLANTFGIAWQGIMLNKLRSFLTTLGIIIGVAAVIIMLAVSAGAEAEIEDQISGLGANLIMVTQFRPSGGVRGFGGGRPGGTPLTYDDALALSEGIAVACVVHAGVVRCGLALAMGAAAPALAFQISYLGATRLRVYEGGLAVTAVNEVLV